MFTGILVSPSLTYNLWQKWDDGSCVEGVTFQGYLDRVRPQIVVDVHGGACNHAIPTPN